LRSFAGWRPHDFGADAVAGLTLAAIAIPEQMATARLAGFPPRIGFFALLAGAIGFAIFGASRRLSVGADSTIAPIFAGALAVLAGAGPAHYATAAAALSLLVGLILICGGALRFGFIADLLSIPVTTGFLIGIAGHILVSQAPSVLGLEPSPGPFAQQALSLIARAQAANPWTSAIGLGVLAVMLASERISPRFPGALIGLCLAELATVALGLEARGVATLGSLGGAAPSFSLPMISWDDFRLIAPLAALIALVVMVQTAATTRSFSDGGEGPDVDRDFIGVGAANMLAGLIGAFPVNASPPRTAIVAETGGVSQLAALTSAALALAVLLVGGQALGHAPRAALAGVLLFVAMRLVRVGVMVDVWRRSRAESLLILATALAILALPIEQGVSVGVLLSVLHGVWTTTRAQAIEFERIPGTSIWWPRDKDTKGELLRGVRVIALQAPLSFLNAYNFRRAIQRFVGEDKSTRLIVIEANALVEIDYTGATVLAEIVRRLRGRGVDVAVARLESVRAQQSFARLGLDAVLGRDHIFHSVQEAIDALTAPSHMRVAPTPLPAATNRKSAGAGDDP
jgi:MFS superfamily sulfate permease-like transporter